MAAQTVKRELASRFYPPEGVPGARKAFQSTPSPVKRHHSINSPKIKIGKDQVQQLSLYSADWVVPIARYSASALAWHRCKLLVLAACVVPVSSIVPILPAGTFRHRRGVTTVPQGTRGVDSVPPSVCPIPRANRGRGKDILQPTKATLFSLLSLLLAYSLNSLKHGLETVAFWAKSDNEQIQ